MTSLRTIETLPHKWMGDSCCLLTSLRIEFTIATEPRMSVQT
jgi:hypothetical protein